jgi:F-type H+-transporting ATPase subunit beta
VKSNTSQLNLGVVTSVRGSVVEARFEDHLPSVYTILRTGVQNEIVINVLSQPDANEW